jgi:uncharacterized membrane protein YjfL (UPF0719 family)
LPFPVAKSISQATTPLEFLRGRRWAGVLQILAFVIVRSLLVKDLGRAD